ncbi:Rossmann-like and DUF2520 domain-containing protein [Membranihabitans maritimus]|uniref:Rossmann-like and DUF2520 domain-containing protein n=1 Tax=Membranihabitans maritimus TaxID=2904244 RepID=UPI001F2C50A2|nr:Rossmann-like and DUF2520 domain-containing protein [Membranihabitans maritimus]
MTENNTIGIIGHGNVGKHLTIALHSSKAKDIVKVYNRSIVPGPLQVKGVPYSQDLKSVANVRILIVCVKDEAIIEMLERIEDIVSPETIVCHCSGSIPSTVIKPYFENYGVFYPLQTFSSNKDVDYSEIPFFITGGNSYSEEALRYLASKISRRVDIISDDQRVSMHIAAIFACNYVNAMYSISHKLCKDFNISFDNLKPLIYETADKIKTLNPAEAQTGPAIRRDWDIIYKHEDFLENYDSNIRAIYREMADYITKFI